MSTLIEEAVAGGAKVESDVVPDAGQDRSCVALEPD